ncbi:unnamed protein product [Rotaria sp. Silwood1]|nr:unnamed protein product [Rotaria sp. Silwood1]CAF0934537.1 unnamed protein product [Rotaria sp. Silwood1]CAF1023753.1 unnamed protein product [Rotaria sp. Silwood1]CAF3370379.1 unnamed protein product [Rotaria sp. Silwood1]CAF3402531.1 unnamed protein product [Rotaria sp. Silwood1]
MDANVDLIPCTSETTASLIINLFSNEINKQDVNGLLHAQNLLLEQLDKTNEKLDGINKLSAERYLDATKEFTNHTHMLTTMKRDLDLIFKRIQLLKMRLNKKYPESYASGNIKYIILAKEKYYYFSVTEINTKQDGSLDDEEDDGLASAIKPINNSSLVKSKTVDCSQLSASIRETYISSQINDNTAEQSSSSLDAVRRFVFNKSSGGQDLTTLFKNARNELRKINESLLGSNNQKQSTSHEE